MGNISHMSLNKLLQYSFECDCGRIHSTNVRKVSIASEALAEIPQILEHRGWRKACVIADRNTHIAAGEKLVRLFKAANVPYSAIVFEDKNLVPDEYAIGSIVMRVEPDCDVIIGVGAGTINDMSRFVSCRLGLPYLIVATAPSMDGYASTVAPLITNNLKITYEATTPEAIIADLDILVHSPREMIAAGFADMLGKYTCLVDWKLSSLITGEYYCETVAEMMSDALNRTVALRSALANGEREAARELMNALALAGVAMGYVGNSRPASGSEHHLSHFWEMRFLFEGKPPVLHGTRVGIASRLILKLYEYLRSEALTADELEEIPINFDRGTWEAEIDRSYGKGAPEVLQLERTVNKNSLSERQKRLQAMARHWDEIQAAMAEMPSSDVLATLLTAVGGPTYPQQIGLDAGTLWDSIMYGKEIRSRYTILQMLWDLDLLQRYADRLVSEEFPKEHSNKL